MLWVSLGGLVPLALRLRMNVMIEWQVLDVWMSKLICIKTRPYVWSPVLFPREKQAKMNKVETVVGWCC